MKRFFAVFLLLLALCLPVLADGPVIDRIAGEQPDFAFAEDAALLEVYFPQIYGCDAALVRYGPYSMLIDCGGPQWKQVSAMLERLNVTELTYALNSHPDVDHIGGFNHVLQKVPAGEFLLGFPEDYPSGDEVRFHIYDSLHTMGVPMRQVKEGDSIAFGDVSVTVYQRTDEHLPRVNNKSVMLMIQYGERRIFFTGDIQRGAQLLLSEDANHYDIKTDILKFPHHGYAAMQEPFLEKTSPSFVVCTGGQANTSGLRQLREKGIPFALTGVSALRLATDGHVWTVERMD